MYIIGIDEVGRGPLAGPVVVAAVAIPKAIKIKSRDKLKDSKKLTPRQRERWFEYIKNHPKIFYATARVYPRKIEKINISNAANLAAANAFIVLFKKHRSLIKNAKTILDGGLYLINSKIKNPAFAKASTGKQKSKIQFKIKNPKTIIKGDEKIPAIALASIVAKVTRDRYMIKLRESYPRYGFDVHKGYGTKSHRRALKKYGASKVHRRSFKLI